MLGVGNHVSGTPALRNKLALEGLVESLHDGLAVADWCGGQKIIQKMQLSGLFAHDTARNSRLLGARSINIFRI